MISVIVATYNQETTIGRTLDGILRQQCSEPLEIIVGEDCSTDGTLAVCRSYEKQYPGVVRVIANRPNKGVVDNYFDCLLAAHGDYLADCAGDDEWSDPLKLEKEVTILRQHPEVVLVHTDYLMRDAATGQLRRPAPKWWGTNGAVEITPGDEMVWHVLEHEWRPAVHLCTALWRADAFRRIYDKHHLMLRDKRYMMEDVQLTALLATEGAMAYIPEATLWYECGKVSVGSPADEDKKFRFQRGVLLCLTDLYCTLGLDDRKQISTIYERHVFALMMHAFRGHNAANRKEALRLADNLLPALSPRIRRVRFATSNAVLWHLALLARKIFVFTKKF